MTWSHADARMATSKNGRRNKPYRFPLIRSANVEGNGVNSLRGGKSAWALAF
jgi:hypothetical protein